MVEMKRFDPQYKESRDIEGWQFIPQPAPFQREVVCLHRGCTECGGTGRKEDGTFCVHMISCSCPSCSPARL